MPSITPKLADVAKLEKEKRAQRLELKAKAEVSLREFAEQAWQVVEPSTPFIPGWNLDAVCEHLQAVSAGQIRNLVINVPPRTAKSLFVSVFWPCWEWIHHPEIRWLFSSYTSKLSLRDSMKCRRVIESAWYQQNWGDKFQLIGDQNTKENYENDKTGQRIATSVSGIGVGAGGDRIVCLAGDALITTDCGLLRIEDIIDYKLSPRILSFDHATGEAQWQPIELHEASEGRSAVRVTFSNSETLECTEDHPVFSAGFGYKKAVELKNGDRALKAAQKTTAAESQLPSLRQEVLSLPSARGEVNEGHYSLQQQVLRGVAERAEQQSVQNGQRRADLRDLQKEVLSETVRYQKTDRALLFDAMPWQGQDGSRSSEIRKSSNRAVLELRQPSETEAQLPNREAELLRAGMREHQSSGTYQRQEQSSLHSRNGGRAISCGVQEDSSTDSRTRQSYLSDVRNQGERLRPRTGCSSHRLYQDEQYTGESNQSLSILPREGSRPASATFEVAEVSVVSCESIATPARVFNIRVAKNHNYFANGILVHNCDDANNVEEVESDLMRQGVLDWWDHTMSTRGNDPKTVARVNVQQRLHEEDLSGHVLEQGGYTHLCLPMRFERDRRCVTTFGGKTWSDPRTYEGELLWPERFGEKEIQELEKRLGSYMAAGQLQQRPSPAGGGMLKAHWWKYWQPRDGKMDPVQVKMPDGSIKMIAAVEIPEKFDTVIQSWDLALKDEKTSDYVVGQVIGAKGANRFIVDQVRERMDLPKTLLAIRQLSARHPNAHAKLIEDKANGPAVIQSLQSKIGGMIAVNPQGGKISRAAAASPMLEAGNWFLPHPQLYNWVEPLLQEFSAFPKGRHDDSVDSWSQAANRLMYNAPVEDEDDATRLRIQAYKSGGWSG